MAPDVALPRFRTARRTATSNSPSSTDNYSDSNTLNFVLIPWRQKVAWTQKPASRVRVRSLVLRGFLSRRNLPRCFPIEKELREHRVLVARTSPIQKIVAYD